MSAAPSPLFPELGTPPVIPYPHAVLLRGCSHVIIAPTGPWSIVLKPSFDGLQVIVKRRNDENRYDNVYENVSSSVTERSVTRLVTDAVGYIVAEVLRSRGVDCKVMVEIREHLASVLVRRDNRLEAVVEVYTNDRRRAVRVGNQSLSPISKDNSLNMNLFLGTATFLSALN